MGTDFSSGLVSQEQGVALVVAKLQNWSLGLFFHVGLVKNGDFAVGCLGKLYMMAVSQMGL